MSLCEIMNYIYESSYYQGQKKAMFIHIFSTYLPWQQSSIPLFQIIIGTRGDIDAAKLRVPKKKYEWYEPPVVSTLLLSSF